MLKFLTFVLTLHLQVQIHGSVPAVFAHVRSTHAFDSIQGTRGDYPYLDSHPIWDRFVEIVYAYNESDTACDIHGFTDFRPVAYAYNDSRIDPDLNEAGYGFARYPLSVGDEVLAPELSDLAAGQGQGRRQNGCGCTQ